MANQKFKVKVQADAGVQLTAETATRALQLDASGNVQSSSVTNTELGHLSGVTSAIQTQLGTNATAISDHLSDTVDAHDASAISSVAAGNLVATDVQAALNELDTEKIATSQKGAANGVATLDANSLIPIAQIPPAALERLVIAADQAARFALTTATVQNGDTVKQTDTGVMYFIKDDTNLGNAAGYEVYSAGTASAVAWSGVTGTPTTIAGYGITDDAELAQDAVGAILVDSSSIDFTYTDATPSITAVVLPAGVDHDSLLNFSANKHIDHTAVVLSGAANGGITSTIGDISASRSISVDITNAVAETVADNADLILIYDNSTTSTKKMTRGNFLSGVPVGSAGDLNEASFSAANNQLTPANVTGFAFANAVVRSFKALVSVEIDATADLFETFELQGIQKGASWDMAVSSVGDNSNIVFSITSAGQVQYTSGNEAGFVSDLIKFRAIVTSI